MYVAKISFTYENEYDIEIEDAIESYIMHQRYDGRIIGKPSYLYKEGNTYSFECQIPEIDALKDANSLRPHSLEKGINAAIEITILGKDMWSIDTCNCEKFDFFVLSGSTRTPLYCGTCDNMVPLYRIPPTYDGDPSFWDIICWGTEYLAWHDIEFFSKLEATAHDQLSNINSFLNQESLAICQRIYEKSGIPCYYHLEKFYVDHEKQCPICGKDWALDTPLLDQFIYKCDTCKILGAERYYSG